MHIYKAVTSFIAEMRHIDNGGGVICDQADFCARGEGLHAFAQAQDREGAQKAEGIYFQIHRSHKRDVTVCPQACDHGPRDLCGEMA